MKWKSGSKRIVQHPFLGSIIICCICSLNVSMFCFILGRVRHLYEIQLPSLVLLPYYLLVVVQHQERPPYRITLTKPPPIYLFIYCFWPFMLPFWRITHTTTATALTAFVPLHVTTTLSVPTRYKNSLLSFILLLALLGPLFYSYHFIHDPMPWLSSILVVDVTS